MTAATSSSGRIEISTICSMPIWRASATSSAISTSWLITRPAGRRGNIPRSGSHHWGGGGWPDILLLALDHTQLPHSFLGRYFSSIQEKYRHPLIKRDC